MDASSGQHRSRVASSFVGRGATCCCNSSQCYVARAGSRIQGTRRLVVACVSSTPVLHFV